MDIKQYLKEQADISLAALAFRMWPNNLSADTYLSNKLSDKENSRKWTKSDEKLARKALKELGVKLIDVSKKQAS